ncbi:MAG TPA: hypothetical protein VH595_11495 [Verrucomicrobiae bacterium]|jgi:hypothetical protein|nr:hypothetical protein [Verrucomicrobiae bacterium]
MEDKTWYQRVFETLSFLCPYAATDIDPDKEPAWVTNVLKQLVQQVMPAVAAKSHEVTPRRLGRLLGQEQANWTAIANAATGIDTAEIRAKGEAMMGQLEAHRENPAAASALQAVEFVGNCLQSIGPLLELRTRISADALVSAWCQPDGRECLAFFQGIVEGLSKPGLPSRFTDATPIYQRLLFHRKEVGQLKSVRELREFLFARGLTGQSLGEPKRLEKLCQRIGLTFSEPGRPKRTN